MLLIELATQAVKGFSPASRIALKPGYNVLAAPAGTSPGLVALLSALFYNDGRGGDAALGSAANARAGLTLKGKDGRVYRLVRALGTSSSLQRLESNNAWSAVSQDSQDINQVLRSALGLPTKGQFEELFCLGPASLPSRRPKAPAAAPQAGPAGLGGHGGGAGGLKPAERQRTLAPNALLSAAMSSAAAAPRAPKVDPARAAADIARLRQEIAAGKELEQLQFKLEGLQQRLFQHAEKLKGAAAQEASAQQMRQSLQETPGPAKLGLDEAQLEKVARYDEAVRKFEESVARLHQESEAATQESAAGGPEPLWSDKGFLGSAALGALTLGVGAAFRGSTLGYVALLDIPAFGYAALCALKWVGERQRFRSLSRRIAMNQDREAKLQQGLATEFAGVRSALEALGLKKGADLAEHLSRRRSQEEALRALEQNIEAAQSDPEVVQAREEQRTLGDEVKALEAEIGRMGAGATRGWQDAERELEELEQALQNPAPPEPAPAAPVAPVATVASAAAAEGPPKEDPAPKLLSLAQDLFPGASLEALAASLRERAGQYLQVLSDRRWSGLALDGRGNAQLIGAAGAVAATAAQDGDLDLLYLAIRFALIEKLSPEGKLTVVLDEPFAGWEPARQELVSKLLKRLGTVTQVVHATASPAHGKWADVAGRI